MTPLRLHVLGLPHTVTHRDYSACAFTAKVRKFCTMMSQRGHHVIHYGHSDSEVQADELVAVTDNQVLEAAYGTEYLAGAWRERGFAHYFSVDDSAHKVFHARAIKEIGKRKQPNDILLCFWGWGHKPIADAHPDMIAIEPGIGYPSAWARWRVYESHSVLNSLSSSDSVGQCLQDWYHVVIPNYFEAEDFEYSAIKQDYILYLGRITASKGVDIAINATKLASKRLIIAGQGSLSDLGYTKTPDHVEMVGFADEITRKKLMSNAQALFIASRYAEPFAGVQVEAWLSGTPVISPDWAAFAEYNRDNITGIRCRTLRDFVQACDTVQYLDPGQCRYHGERFLLDRVAPEYERYFQDVLNVYTGAGWDQLDADL